jgi:hypothetical protein
VFQQKLCRALLNISPKKDSSHQLKFKRISIAKPTGAAGVANAPVAQDALGQTPDFGLPTPDFKLKKHVQIKTFQNLHGQAKNIAAHILGTIGHQRIVGLSSGTVTDQGSPSELISRGGYYAEITNRQAI